MRKFILLASSILALLLVFQSCAEKKPDKELLANSQRLEKSFFSGTFHFGETVTKSPVEVSLDEQPGRQAYFSRMVRFDFTEKYLNIVEITPRTESIIQNPNNSVGTERVISRFPISRHIDIRREKDDYGDETNKIIETEEDNPWNLRKYAIIDFGHEEILDRSFYIEQVGGNYQDPFISQSSGGEITELFVSQEVINITAKKTFKSSSYGESGTVLAEIRYSFLPEVKSNYRAMEYPEEWEARMGYFKTSVVTENKYGIKEIKHFLNRMNPKKRVVYYLSKSWNNPGAVKLKSVAYKTVAKWNKVFKNATGIDNYIELRESDGSQKIGDLRYNMIQWVDENFPSSPLGYGPSTVHPRTGEIINANVIIYGGSLRNSIFFTRVLDPELSSPLSTPTSGISASSILNSNLGNLQTVPEVFQTAKELSTVAIKHTHEMDMLNTISSSSFKTALENFHTHFENSKTELSQKLKDPLAMYVPNGCVFEMPHNRIAAGIDAGMSDDEIAERILLHTLIHELGHNFGLRHNFRGSVDQKNFFTEKDSEGQFLQQSSSIMDYTDNFHHDLYEPGTYDIAAIEMAYSNDSLPSTIDFQFMYCTDHQRFSDPLCNTFDKGTSATEIALNMAMDYHKYYEIRNKKVPWVKRFNTPQKMQSYINGLIINYFIPMRMFLDYKSKYSSVLSEEEKEDLNVASLLAFKFFNSALYNDHRDLNVANEFGELLEIGTLYDRFLALEFLTMESLGAWGLDFEYKITFLDILKDLGYNEQIFYNRYTYAPLGMFKKYDLFQEFVGENYNFMRPEIRLIAVSTILRNMDSLGSKAKHQMTSYSSFGNITQLETLVEALKQNSKKEITVFVNEMDPILKKLKNIQVPSEEPTVVAAVAEFVEAVEELHANLKEEKLPSEQEFLLFMVRLEGVLIAIHGEPIPEEERKELEAMMKLMPQLKACHETKEKAHAATLGLLEDEKNITIFDMRLEKIINTPKRASISSEVSYKYQMFMLQLDELKSSLKAKEAMLENPGLNTEEKKKLQAEITKLKDYIDIYIGYLDSELDMLYEMADIYKDLTPGNN